MEQQEISILDVSVQNAMQQALVGIEHTGCNGVSEMARRSGVSSVDVSEYHCRSLLQHTISESDQSVQNGMRRYG
jgi:hypothetical protein